MSCPNCGSTAHISCTRKENVDAIERRVAGGESPMDAAFNEVAREVTAIFVARLKSTAEDLHGMQESLQRLLDEWPDGGDVKKSVEQLKDQLFIFERVLMGMYRTNS